MKKNLTNHSFLGAIAKGIIVDSAYVPNKNRDLGIEIKLMFGFPTLR